ncbi:MAG: ATP-binding cassette domain-containing protein [Proteobacteria bacterium]|nr:ATP-binding cassette domain-containing protein [Pseudomonadota bacterium]
MEEQKSAIELIDASIKRGSSYNFKVFRQESVLVSGGTHQLVELILGRISPRSGIIRLLGQDLSSLSQRSKLHLRTRCGVLPEAVSLLNNLTVFANIGLPLRYHSGLDDDEVNNRVVKTLEHYGMSHLGPLRPALLDRSQQRMVALIRALLAEPEVLILEDPFEGVDESRYDMMRTMVDEAVDKGCGVLITTDNVKLETSFDGQLLKFRSCRVLSV